MSLKSAFLKHWPLALLLFLIGYIYAGVIDGPFVFDDKTSILSDSAIQIHKLDIQSLYQAGFESVLPTRFFANITFALNHLASGLETRSYHVTNIVIHGINALLLFFLLQVLLTRGSLVLPAHYRRWLPLLTVFLWALHPVQTQAVSYIVQRMTELALMFYLLSLLFYLASRLSGSRGIRWVCALLAVLSGLLALSNKENAATLPIAVLLVEWIFLQQADWRWLKERGWVLTGAVACVLIAGLIYTNGNLWEHITGDYVSRNFTLEERLLTQPRVIAHYLYLWFIPHPEHFNLDYDFPLSNGILSPPTTLLAIGTLLALLGLALKYVRPFPLPAFGILWFFLTLAIESSVIPLEIIFEHRMYMPSIGVALITAMMLLSIKSRALKVFSVLVLLPGLAWSTHERNRVWSDEIVLLQDVIAKSPTKDRGYGQLGTALLQRQRWAEGIAALNQALAINPGNHKTHINLAAVHLSQGQLDLAVYHLAEAKKLAPNDLVLLYNLAKLAAKQKEWRVSWEYLRRILDLYPDQALAHERLAEIYERWQNHSKVEFHYGKAIELEPGQANHYFRYGNYLARRNEQKKALSLYEKGFELLPSGSSHKQTVQARLNQLRARVSHK